MASGRAPGQNGPKGMVPRKPEEQSTDSVGKRTVPAVCVFLALAVLLVFSRTLRHGFINFDDSVYVYTNAEVTNGLTWHGIGWAFTHSHAGFWHPLTSISHMLDCQLYGLHAGGHHLTSVLLHAATAILLFLVLRRMTGALWPSAFVAVVFAIHPLRVESVAWVAERKDVLSGLFFVLTLAAYVGYARHPFSWARYLSVVVLFALGLMAKPVLVTLPLVLLLLDYWPLGRWGTGPFFGVGTGPFFGAGTGPFFGEKTSLANRRLTENMDLSPSAARGGQSHFRGENAGWRRQSPPRRENWDSPL